MVQSIKLKLKSNKYSFFLIKISRPYRYYWNIILRCLKEISHTINKFIKISRTIQYNKFIPETWPNLRSGQCMLKLLNDYKFKTVLDIGCGAGLHSNIFLKAGKKVDSLDYGKSVYFKKNSDSHNAIVGDYNTIKLKCQYDLIWASHVLEHQLNVVQFLKKIFSDCKEGGIVAITIPPSKRFIVGGHLTHWNAGLLLYNMIVAGNDCSDAAILTYDLNISIIVTKKTIINFPEICYDVGDIGILSNYFPDGYYEHFDGEIYEHNWFNSTS